MFDWQRFLDNYNIEYITSGHNARRHVIAIKCPLCFDDPSYHLGISTRGRGYHCWREKSHSGKAPQRLIMALIGCTYSHATSIVQVEEVNLATTDETFAQDMFRHLGIKDAPRQHAGKLEFLPEFQAITNTGLCGKLIFPYLTSRGYSAPRVLRLSRRFNLQYALKGRFAYRVIIPVYMDDELVTWTGRAVTNDELRYRTLSTDTEKAAKQNLPPALMNIKDCLFDYDNLTKGGQTLVVSEGPFDAMRITFFGEEDGILGTCLFSKNALPAQIDLLFELRDRYAEVVSLMDEDVGFGGFGMFPDSIGVKSLRLPPNTSDPADLTLDKFHQLFNYR